MKKICISVLFNDETETIEWLQFLLENYKKYIKVSYDVYINCNKEINIKHDDNIFISTPLIKTVVGGKLLAGHIINYEMAKSKDYELFTIMASNCCFIKDLNDTTFSLENPIKIQKINIDNFIETNWSWNNVRNDGITLKMISDNNFKFLSGGQNEGLVVCFKEFQQVINFFNTYNYKDLIKSYGVEEILPHTIITNKNMWYTYICIFIDIHDMDENIYNKYKNYNTSIVSLKRFKRCKESNKKYNLQ